MDKYLIINISKNKVLKISKSMIEEMSAYRQLKNFHNESGGVLIGSILSEKKGYIIDKFTPPQPKDNVTRFSFFRSQDHHELVRKIWKDSKYHSTYLGLWHTHPEDIPRYSPVDKKDWIEALKKSKYDGNYLFFFIFGRTHFSCWIGTKHIIFSKINFLGEYKYE